MAGILGKTSDEGLSDDQAKQIARAIYSKLTVEDLLLITMSIDCGDPTIHPFLSQSLGPFQEQVDNARTSCGQIIEELFPSKDLALIKDLFGPHCLYLFQEAEKERI